MSTVENMFADAPSQQGVPEEDKFAIELGDANMFADAPSQQAAPTPAQVIEDVSRQDPDRAATVFNAANKSDIPVGLVDTNLEEVQRQQRVKDSKPETFGPTLNKMMGIPEKAVLMQDDLENLRRTEELMGKDRSFGEGTAGFFKSLALDMNTMLFSVGQQAVEKLADPTSVKGFLAAKYFPETTADVVVGGSKFFGQMAQSSMAQSEEAMPQFENEWVNSGMGGLKSAVNMVALATVLGPAALPVMVAQQQGMSYVRARKQGMSPTDAQNYANIQGGIEWITEKIPFGRVMNDVGKKTLYETLKRQWVELPGEQVATLLQDLTDWSMLPENSEKPFQSFLDERVDAGLHTLLASSVGTVAQTTVMHTIGRIASGPVEKQASADKIKMDASKQGQEELDEIIKLSQESKLSGRAQDVYKEFLAGAGSEQNVYLPSDILSSMIEDVEIPQSFLDQIDGLGADIEIPMDIFMTEVTANEELLAALRPHIRMGADQLSATDIENGGDMTTRRLIERAQVAAEAHQEIADLSDTIVEQLINTGRMTRAEASKNTALWVARINTMVVDHNMTPNEAYEYINTNIVGQDAPGLADAQVIEQDQDVKPPAADLTQVEGLMDRLEALPIQGHDNEDLVNNLRINLGDDVADAAQAWLDERRDAAVTAKKQQQREVSNKKRVAKAQTNLAAAKTPVDKLSAAHAMAHTAKMQEDTTLAAEAEAAIAALEEEGYEISNMLGVKYNEGMMVSAEFVEDESMYEDEEVITRVRTPQINKDGVMVQSANVIVSIGTKSRDETVNTLAQAKKDGYEGEDATEATAWNKGIATYGAEGMTVEARMKRAKAQGYDTETVMYHGTDQTFDGFEGVTFLTEHAGEASAYSNVGAMVGERIADKIRGKHRGIELTKDQYEGRLVPYVGVIDDISSIGEVWATDEGVVIVNEDGTIDVATNVDVDYEGEYDAKEGTISLKEGDGVNSSKGRAIDDLDSYAEESASDINTEYDSPQVIPVYTKTLKLKDVGPLHANILGKRLRGGEQSAEQDKEYQDLLDEVESLKAEGYQGFSTTSDEGILNPELAGVRQVIVFDPSNIRSVNAAFNDADVDSTQLLAQSEIDLINEILAEYDTRAPARPVEEVIAEMGAGDLAGYTDARIKHLINEWGYVSDRVVASIVRVSPLDFVKATARPGQVSEIQDDAGDLDIDRLRGETHTPELRVEEIDGELQITGHEGRHRMAALAKSGVTSVPVVVYNKDVPHDNPTMGLTDGMSLRGQPISPSDPGTDINIFQPVDIKHGGAADIAAVHGDNPDTTVLFQRQIGKRRDMVERLRECMSNTG